MAAAAGVAAESPPALRLAEELFAEGDAPALREECRRVAREISPEESAPLEFLAAMADLQIFPFGSDEYAAAVTSLMAMWRADEKISVSDDLRALAALEAARAAWEGRHPSADVFDALHDAFIHLRDPDLFPHAACTLYFYLKIDKPARNAHPDLWMALATCRDSWSLEVWHACNPRTNGSRSRRGASLGRIGSWPGRAVVAFYRAQISPALGTRCSLEPSCSEYFLRASRAHGLLGIPLMADRLIREPSVVKAAAKTTERPDGSIRIADPLEEHDSWLK